MKKAEGVLKHGAQVQKEKRELIRLLAMDVDGTLTDGNVYIDSRGNEMKGFHVQDGMGLALLRRSDVRTAIISGRYSRATELRAKELSVDVLYNGVGNKLEVLKNIAEELGLGREEIAFAGDDINDIECIKWAGLGFAVNNALKEVKESADYVTEKNGGNGAMREVCVFILEYNENHLRDTGDLK